MCGDHGYVLIFKHFKQGSPPHVRGPPITRLLTEGYAGITPACAGTTFFFLSFYNVFWDHPRMCGDHIIIYHHWLYCPGSPPHVRGPQAHINPTFCPLGITPACAGTTR